MVEMRHHSLAADVGRLYGGVSCSLLERFIIHMRSHFSSYDIIASHVPMSGKILDLGAGFGILSIYLALLSKKRHIKGVDISRRRIRIASAASSFVPTVSFERSNFLGTNFEDNDCILLIDTLHYFPDAVQNEILKKCYHQINPGGTIIIRDSNRDYKFRQLITRLHETIMTKSGFTKGDGLYFRRFCEMKKFVEGLGFNVCVMPMWGLTPFADTLMVCKKK